MQVTKIWDQAPHNAFTDLIRFDDAWFCVFREGEGHVSPDGALRVIRSTDGDHWESAALIESTDSDLRDAKITITPDHRLMLSGAASYRFSQPAPMKHQSLAWFSPDGIEWSAGVPIADPDFWLWRTTWHKGVAYGVGYATGESKLARLYQSRDGEHFEVLVDRLLEEGYPNETSMVFLEDDSCLCLIRRDGDLPSALLGRAAPPYTDWTWQDLGIRFGGPHMIRLPDGRFVAVGRLYDDQVRTSLCWLDPEQGSLTEFVPLPSGGDTSYPGLVWHEDRLWVSYYSSHEGKTSIYLAIITLEELR